MLAHQRPRLDGVVCPPVFEIHDPRQSCLCRVEVNRRHLVDHMVVGVAATSGGGVVALCTSGCNGFGGCLIFSR